MLSKARDFFLGAYDQSDFVLREKAKILLILYATVFVVMVTLLFASPGSSSETHAIEILGTVILIVFAFVLRSGRYALAAHTLTIGFLVGPLSVMFTDKGGVVARLDTVAIILGVLALTPLTVTKRKLAIILYFVAAVSAFLYFVHLQSRLSDTTHEMLEEYVIDSMIGMSIVGVASYLVFSINKRALDKASESIALATAEAEKNGELNRTLETKVAERTQELHDAMKKLESANQDLTRARDALWGEMELATKIQTVLLPKHPVMDGYEISTYMAPATEVGGDYYDVINCAGIDWIVIGDVSGHGVSAGLVMMMVQTSIHVTLANNPNLPPSVLLAIINKTITRNIQQLGESKYVTITVLAAYENGRFSFSGLHQDIMVYRGAKQGVEVVETSGPWIGLIDDIGGMLTDMELRLDVGDTMLLYTDGITEAWTKESNGGPRNPATDMFGDARLKTLLGELGESSPPEIKDGIIGALGSYRCSDDVTMVVMQRHR